MHKFGCSVIRLPFILKMTANLGNFHFDGMVIYNRTNLKFGGTLCQMHNTESDMRQT